VQLDGRTIQGDFYRRGFNGMEKDDEVKGGGNSYDYKNRFYDPRIARFLSIDKLTHDFPWYTPYQFAGNKPTIAIDIDGLEEYLVISYFSSDGSLIGWGIYHLEIQKASDVRLKQLEKAKESMINRKIQLQKSRENGEIGKKEFNTSIEEENYAISNVDLAILD
jgi:RHS repeat-associated protein